MFALKYGLTRHELRYILDPADVKGEDYPSETFRGLKVRRGLASGNTERRGLCSRLSTAWQGCKP